MNRTVKSLMQSTQYLFFISFKITIQNQNKQFYNPSFVTKLMTNTLTQILTTKVRVDMRKKALIQTIETITIGTY